MRFYASALVAGWMVSKAAKMVTENIPSTKYRRRWRDFWFERREERRDVVRQVL